MFSFLRQPRFPHRFFHLTRDFPRGDVPFLCFLCFLSLDGAIGPPHRGLCMKMFLVGVEMPRLPLFPNDVSVPRMLPYHRAKRTRLFGCGTKGKFTQTSKQVPVRHATVFLERLPCPLGNPPQIHEQSVRFFVANHGFPFLLVVEFSFLFFLPLVVCIPLVPIQDKEGPLVLFVENKCLGKMGKVLHDFEATRMEGRRVCFLKPHQLQIFSVPQKDGTRERTLTHVDAQRGRDGWLSVAATKRSVVVEIQYIVCVEQVVCCGERIGLFRFRSFEIGGIPRSLSSSGRFHEDSEPLVLESEDQVAGRFVEHHERNLFLRESLERVDILKQTQVRRLVFQKEVLLSFSIHIRNKKSGELIPK
mmetsp:Transcript_42978/g.111019  ORF Transcript_42978/g.111019 Transcript_42978/m.111019 type:complete len:360 (+) Transcript_42978:1110-2189(+)